MNLKNYTSTIPAHKSISKIEALLVECGASNIIKNYGPEGELSSISFRANVQGNWLSFQLPARVNAVFDIFKKQHPQTYKAKLQDQANRTAWKIIYDWVQIQMTMIKLEQAEFLEIFLPYVWNGTETFFSRVKGSDFKLLQ